MHDAAAAVSARRQAPSTRWRGRSTRRTKLSGAAHLPAAAARAVPVVAGAKGARHRVASRRPARLGRVSRRGDRTHVRRAARGSTPRPPRVSGKRSARCARCCRDGRAAGLAVCADAEPAPALVARHPRATASARGVLRLGRRPGLAEPRCGGSRAGRRRRRGARRDEAGGGHATLVVAPESLRDARGRCSSRQTPALAALEARVKAQFRSARPVQSRPHAGRAIAMQTNFSLAQLADPDIAEAGQDPARLRALRFLHRDLPDLCAARRRTRQPARAHLSDQGHAGERPPGDAGSGQAYRSLPVLPVLHDDLPFGRATTCIWSITPAHHIEKTYRRPWLDRMLRRVLGFVLPRPGLFRLALAAPRCCKAVRRPLADAAAPGAGRWRRNACRRASAIDQARRSSRRIGPKRRRVGAADRLRAKSAGAADQRGDHRGC